MKKMIFVVVVLVVGGVVAGRADAAGADKKPARTIASLSEGCHQESASRSMVALTPMALSTATAPSPPNLVPALQQTLKQFLALRRKISSMRVHSP